jgi:hypothetical protein
MAVTAGKVVTERMQADIANTQDELEAGAAGIQAFAVDGALTKTTGIKVLTKGSVGAYSLAAPTADEAGRRLTIINGSAFAHVITATNLIDDGVTGGAKDTATFAAFVGASIELIAYNGKWTVLTKNVVTIAGA